MKEQQLPKPGTPMPGSLTPPNHDNVEVTQVQQEVEEEIIPKPQINNVQKDISSVVNVAEVKPGKKGIQVVAQRKGFYNQTRLKQGDTFSIKSEDHFGNWFICVDPDMEKKRVEHLKNKKSQKAKE